MSHASVQQLQYLNAVFQEVLTEFNPGVLAVLGCATGNGFEHIPRHTSRVVGVDINPAYLDTLRSRFADRLEGLELICNDMSDCDFEAGSLTLVHCALVFEYVDPAPAVEKIAAWLCRGGVLTVVLQMPSSVSGPVTETESGSLRILEPIMHLVVPAMFTELAARTGLVATKSRVDTLATGKQFYVGWYAKESSSH